MFALLYKKLRRNPSFLRNIGRNASPVKRFFSTEAHALDLGNEDGGKGVLSSRNYNNPRSSSSSVAGAQDDSGKASEVTTKTLLRRYGFTDTHLSKLRTQRPCLFTSVAAQKNLLANLEFFRGLGFSNADFRKIACVSPSLLLCCSLKNQIVPWYNFMKDLLLLLSPDSEEEEEEEGVVKIMKRDPRLITGSIEKTISPNVAALREAGVPHLGILYLLRNFPAIMGFSSLRQSVKEATEMGFDPNKITFVCAVRVLACMSKSTWDKKMEAFRICGMTDAQIFTAFRLFPTCMLYAEENIVQTMNFLVKKMGWLPVDVAGFPTVIGCSLEKRTIPRCRVVRYLQGKGLLRKTISFSSFLSMKKEDFMDKFVKKYEDDVPTIMDIYLVSLKHDVAFVRPVSEASEVASNFIHTHIHTYSSKEYQQEPGTKTRISYVQGDWVWYLVSLPMLNLLYVPDAPLSDIREADLENYRLLPYERTRKISKTNL